MREFKPGFDSTFQKSVYHFKKAHQIKSWYGYTMECYTAIKKNEVIPFAATQDTTRDYHTKQSQKKTNTTEHYLHVESMTCGKYGTNEPI